MIRIVSFVALLLTGGTAVAQERAADGIDASDRREIAGVILGQMAAFKAGNGHAAFAFSASNVREKFGSPETFMRIIRESYQPVYNPRSVSFGSLIASPLGPVQRVFVLDPNAVAYVAYYLMERGGDDRWRIAGCILTPGEEREA